MVPCQPHILTHLDAISADSIHTGLGLDSHQHPLPTPQPTTIDSSSASSGWGLGSPSPLHVRFLNWSYADKDSCCQFIRSMAMACVGGNSISQHSSLPSDSYVLPSPGFILLLEAWWRTGSYSYTAVPCTDEQLLTLLLWRVLSLYINCYPLK